MRGTIQRPAGWRGAVVLVVVWCGWIGLGPGAYAQPGDCNGNGIPDDCDLQCDGAGLPCGMAGCGQSQDCDGSGVPDECETSMPFIRESGSLSPFGVGQEQHWTVHAPPPALADPVLIVNVQGDAAWEGRLVRAFANDVDLGALPIQGIPGQPQVGRAAFLVMGVAAYKAAVAGRDLHVRVLAEPAEGLPAAESVAMELAYATTTDCNGNGLLDTCEPGGLYTVSSGELSPFGGDSYQLYGIPNPPTAFGSVTFQFTARADLSGTSRYVDVYQYDPATGWLALGKVFATTGETCPAQPNVAELTVSAAQFNACRYDGSVFLYLLPSSSVNSAACQNPSSYIKVTTRYHVGGDCNNNARLDSCDIEAGSSVDVDGNGIPDECEPDCNGNGVPDGSDLAAGTSLDCNGNAVPDECDLGSGTSPDCNLNAWPDECDISAGLSTDLNGDGVPDECQDCDANGIPDACDRSCGEPGGPCDFAGCGTSRDCNANGQMDECEAGGAAVTASSPQLTPLGYESPQQYRFLGLPPAGGPVTLRVTARGDFGNNAGNCQTEYLDVYAGGVRVGTLFFSDGLDCPGTPQSRVLTLSAEQYNAAARGGELVVDLVPNYRVSATECTDPNLPSFGQVAVSYQTLSDCNANHTLDACEIRDGTAADCNANGIPDECDFDCNGNGVPDACDIASGMPDCNGNGRPDTCDMLGNDCNANGLPDECDIAGGTSHDCNHNGLPDECDLQGAPLLFGVTGMFALAGPGQCFSFPMNAQIVAGGDFNEDGRPDLAVAGLIALSRQVSVVLGDGSGGFGPPTLLGGGQQGSAILAADLNADGHLDLAVGDVNGNISVYLGDGTGAFAPQASLAVGDDALYLAAGDFNEDGILDLAAAAQPGGEPRVSVFLGTGGGQFAPASLFSSYTTPISLAAADFNADGHLDLAVGLYADRITLMWGDGTGRFSEPGSGLRLPEYLPTALAAADFNEDGRPDLACANVYGGSVSILLNRGAGGFSQPIGFRVSDEPLALAAADLNADGHLDLAVTNYAAQTVSVLAGTGGGLFATQRVFGIGGQPTSLAAGDFDGDGDLDLAVVGIGSTLPLVVLSQGVAGSGDCDSDGVPDECEPDCNRNKVPDDCDLAAGTSHDCDQNGKPDECEIAGHDCNGNNTLDQCDIAAGTSTDCNANQIPDECEPDNDKDAIIDVCDPDDDNDGILDDGDGSGTIGDHPCTGGNTAGCDDNCQFAPNPDQRDRDGDGVAEACDACPHSVIGLPMDASGCSVQDFPGDIDRDGDVDQSDFGLLQACLSGTGVAQKNSACLRARMNADTWVDKDDVILFGQCLRGAGVPGDPTCTQD